MSNNNKPTIIFGNKEFINVTNETTAKETFTTREAMIYGYTGVRIYSSD